MLDGETPVALSGRVYVRACEENGVVRPGDTVTIRGEKVFFRRRKLRSRVEMQKDDGTVVCSGEVSGMGVPL